MLKDKIFKSILLICLMIVWGNMWAQSPAKCTSTDDLKAGDVYYISAAEEYSSTASVMGMSTGGNYFPASTFGEAPCELTLGGNATSGWTFSYVDNGTTYYLDPTNTTSSNYLKRNTSLTNYGKFTISFSDGAAIIKSKGKSDRNTIRFYSYGNYYSCYTSGQVSVYLYKKDSSGTGSESPVNASWQVYPESVSVKTGKTALAEIATNYNGVLSVSSNNSNVATASISGKVITVTGVSEGSTTIVVTGAATNAYNAISKTIDITVTPLRPENEIFYESFDQCVGTGGNDGKWSGSIASGQVKFDNTGWDKNYTGGANNCLKIGDSNYAGYATTPELGVVCNAKLSFMAAAWNTQSESTTLKLIIEGGGSFGSEGDANTLVTLKRAEWQMYELPLSGLSANSKIRFQCNSNSNSRFFLDEVSVVKMNATITLNAACHDVDGIVYSTYSNGSAFVVPSDINVYKVAANGKSLSLHAYKTGDVVPANTGVLVAANEGGNYTVALTNAAGTSILGTDNALRPSGDAGIAAASMNEGNGKMYYRLTMHNGTEFGFWWGAENGAAFGLAANKAYLVIDTTSSGDAKPAMGIVFNTNEATAISSVVTNNAANAVRYNLNGQRILSTRNGGGYKGIVIMNGKKYINK